MLKLELEKLRQNLFCPFFKCLLNFFFMLYNRNLTKSVYQTFCKFQLQSMSSKIERVFEKRKKKEKEKRKKNKHFL